MAGHRIVKRGNRYGYYARWTDKKGVKYKRWYYKQYAGKVREDLPALIKRGWSGKKILKHLRTRRKDKLHLRTQHFYDIYREEKRAHEKQPVIKKVKPTDVIPKKIVVLTELNLSTKHLLVFEYDIFDSQGNMVDTMEYALNLEVLCTEEEAIRMIKARVKADESDIAAAPMIPYRDNILTKQWYYNNYRLKKVWKRREKPIRRVKRGQRYGTRYKGRTLIKAG